MTEPQGSAPPTPEGARPGSTDLEAYLEANWSAYTEPVLRQRALEAGHDQGAVNAALATVRARHAPRRSGAPTGTVGKAYLLVFVALTLGMIISASSPSASGMRPYTVIAIGVLAIALGAGFLASLLWFASRTAFAVLATAGFGLWALLLGSDEYGRAAGGFVLPAVVTGLCLLAAVFFSRRRSTSGASQALLLSMPLLILLAIGGACISTGLPIPLPEPGT